MDDGAQVNLVEQVALRILKRIHGHRTTFADLDGDNTEWLMIGSEVVDLVLSVAEQAASRTVKQQQMIDPYDGGTYVEVDKPLSAREIIETIQK